MEMQYVDNIGHDVMRKFYVYLKLTNSWNRSIFHEVMVLAFGPTGIRYTELRTGHNIIIIIIIVA